jgi:hypothetical protein
MAIIINGRDVEILGGIIISDLYLRFEYNLDLTGTNIKALCKIYPTKKSYLENPNTNEIFIPEIQGSMDIFYNSENDNPSILSMIHDKYKEYLTEDKTSEIPIYIEDPSDYGLVFDSSTGRWADENGNYFCETTNHLCDPVTNEPITEETIMIPKFCEVAQLTIVDMGTQEPK